MTELQINSRRNIVDLLQMLASKEEQLKYQQQVPFVDVPVELFCQWDSHYIINQEWFRSTYSSAELKAMANFKQILEDVYSSFEKLPPIEEFILTTEWKRLSQAASTALTSFVRPEAV